VQHPIIFSAEWDDRAGQLRGDQVALGTLGYGHDYAAQHYIPAWAETLAPEGWTAEDEARLIAHLSGLVPR